MQSTYESLASRGTQAPRAPRRQPSTLRGAAAGVWSVVQALSQRQAAAEILDLADSLQASRPETAAQMRRAVARAWD